MPKFKISFPLLFGAEYDVEIDKSDIEVAWNIYCELVTRVGVVDFIEDEDIINICFESWYSLFKIVRIKLKDLKVPIRKEIDKNSKNLNLDDILFRLLNEHIRPFLRKWHYTFNLYWKDNYKSENDPILIQKKFPNYPNLIKDINILQKKLKEVVDALEKIVKWDLKKYLTYKIWFYLKLALYITISISIFLIFFPLLKNYFIS